MNKLKTILACMIITLGILYLPEIHANASTVTIDEATFPDSCVRKFAQEQDVNKDGVLSDEERNMYIIQKCKNLEKRDIVWNTVIALCIPQENTIKTFNGKIIGKIPKLPYGNNGFGFDSIFELEGCKTIACLTTEEKNKISPRKIALEKLKDYLIEYQLL